MTCLQVVRERIMTYLQVECSYRRTAEVEEINSIQRRNGRVPVLDDPPTLASSALRVFSSPSACVALEADSLDTSQEGY